jgi:hypothetical protein
MATSSNKVVTKEQASFTELLENREAIILDLENLHYYSLNAAASFLWQHMRTGAAPTVADLSLALAAAFGIDAGQAEADTRALLGDLERYGLITHCTAEAAGKRTHSGPATAAPLPAYAPPQLKLSDSLINMTLSGSSTVVVAALGP